MTLMVEEEDPYNNYPCTTSTKRRRKVHWKNRRRRIANPFLPSWMILPSLPCWYSGFLVSWMILTGTVIAAAAAAASSSSSSSGPQKYNSQYYPEKRKGTVPPPPPPLSSSSSSSSVYPPDEQILPDDANVGDFYDPLQSQLQPNYNPDYYHNAPMMEDGSIPTTADTSTTTSTASNEELEPWQQYTSQEQPLQKMEGEEMYQNEIPTQPLEGSYPPDDSTTREGDYANSFQPPPMRRPSGIIPSRLQPKDDRSSFAARQDSYQYQYQQQQQQQQQPQFQQERTPIHYSFPALSTDDQGDDDMERSAFASPRTDIITTYMSTTRGKVQLMASAGIVGAAFGTFVAKVWSRLDLDLETTFGYANRIQRLTFLF